MLTDVAERLAEYKMFYPDATITRVGFEDCNSISHEDGLKLSEQVCHMTHSGLLQFVIFQEQDVYLQVERVSEGGCRLQEWSQGKVPRSPHAR